MTNTQNDSNSAEENFAGSNGCLCANLDDGPQNLSGVGLFSMAFDYHEAGKRRVS